MATIWISRVDKTGSANGQKSFDLTDHDLPLVWMTLLVFGITYLITAATYSIVMPLAVGERARSFKAVSPGLLPPVGIIFGLFVAFTAAQVWNDSQQATATVDREASALRAVVIWRRVSQENPTRVCATSFVGTLLRP